MDIQLQGFFNPLKVVYSHSKAPASVKSSTRYIPQTPDRILDAPDIMDDYCKFVFMYLVRNTIKFKSSFFSRYLL
jgi:hypothetical protein